MMDAPLRARLVELIHTIHRRGWAPGTGGNFSLVLDRAPLRLLITPSGVDKGRVSEAELLEVGTHGEPLRGTAKPSAETLLHLAVVEMMGAQVVLHTHSIWNTLASLQPSTGSVGGAGQFHIAGFEMLKGLRGVTTHEHVEQIPILANSQDMPKLRGELEQTLRANPQAHAVLVAGHGMYTWGADLAEAQRHLEVLEFLFEVVLRRN
jgi:methylthioribulose-1-phosphate dehydratase